MSTAPNFLDLPWRWQMFGGRAVLVAEGARVLLTGEHRVPILTRDPQSGDMRPIDPTDDLAKIIAAAPDVRRHAQALLSGLDLGCIRIDPDDGSDRSTLNNVLKELREALARSGAR